MRHFTRFTNRAIFCLALLGLTFSHNQASAGPTYFYGNDPGNTGVEGTLPISDAQRAAWVTAASALGTVHLIDFESAPLGTFTSLSLGQGVTVTLTNSSNTRFAADVPPINDGIAVQDPFAQSEFRGYNVTPGGSQFLRLIPPSPFIGDTIATFTFDTPIAAFSSFLTGLGTAGGTLHFTFNDGTSQDQTVAGDPTGGAVFFGFTDAGKQISQVSYDMVPPPGATLNGDVFGIDDVRFASVVPEPSAMALLSIGAAGLVGFRKLRKKTAWVKS